VILGTLWPLQSESAWGAFAALLKAEALRLFGEDDEQQGILRQVAADQYGAFIETAIRLVTISSNTLAARYKTYADTSGTADAVGRRIWATKLRMAESVENAERTITAAEDELNPKIAAAEAAGQAAAAAAFKGELDGRRAAAITLAQGEVVTAAAEGSADITALDAKVVASQANNDSSMAAPPAAGMSWGTAPAAPPPAIPTDSHGVHAVDYQRSLNGADRAGISEAAATNNDNGHLPHDNRDARVPEPTVHDAPSTASSGPGKTGSPASTPSVAASSPSSGGSGSGGSPSVLASMMKPSTAPTSAGSPASGAGSPASGSPSGTPGAASPTGQTAASGTGTSAGISRAVSAASAGTGIAEATGRMGTGAISATSNVLGAATNIGGQQVAQGSTGAPTAAGPAAPVTLPASGSPTPAATGPAVPPAAAPPMAVMPAMTAPPVTGGPPSTPPAAAITHNGMPGSSAAPSAASGPVPAPMPMSQMHAVGAEAATGDVLIGQAADAARSVLETLIAQTRRAGYGTSGFIWAVSVIADRTGQFTAWLASSEGPSYVPRGVRMPDDVRLAVNDQVVGRELWEAAAACGGADPLDLLVQHAQMVDAAAPGSRVLVLAAALPIDRVADWAALLGARPVSVDPRTIDPAAAHHGEGQHRCAAAMPWEWQQANAFDHRQRRQIAAQYAAEAAAAGHLNDPACTRVIDAFRRGQAITESDWADITQAHAVACVNYDMTRMAVHAGGAASDPSPLERVFRTARAAEVVLCLRESSTAEGCADLLYASRLAGAPLSPTSAAA